MKCASPTLALTGLPSAVAATGGSRVDVSSDGPPSASTLRLAPLALLGSVGGADGRRVRRGDRESLFDGSFAAGRSKLSFTPTVAASAIAAPFAAWPVVVCCCCEGDGALVKKDVIGAAGFCGVAFLADIVDTIERLSLFVPCVTAERGRGQWACVPAAAVGRSPAVMANNEESIVSHSKQA